MKLKIQGTIVSADYDDPYFADRIDRGIITPSNRVVAALDSLGRGETVELYVNSSGGDVFAGGEMLIALEKAQAAGRLASVEVGAIAASMAANIVAALKARGAKVSVSGNSNLMFHGCHSYAAGGAQHHEDVAASLRNINNAVIADLNRIGITDCRAWFAEGREKWIDANEAVSLKIADVISMGAGDAPVEAKKTASRLAAFAAKVKTRSEYQMELDKTIKAEKAAETTPATAETPAETPKSDAPDASSAAGGSQPESPAAEMERRLAGLQAAKDREIAALKAQIADIERRGVELAAGIEADWKEKLSAATAETENLKTEIGAKSAALDAAKAEVEQLRMKCAETEKALADTQAALKVETERYRAQIGGALQPPQTEGSDAARSWRAAYRAMRGGNQ